MTQLMKQAIEQLRSVPESQQDGLAEFLLHELAEDKRWADTTGANLDRVDAIIRDVLADDDAGRCIPLNPDEL
jgi:hypothetical protein